MDTEITVAPSRPKTLIEIFREIDRSPRLKSENSRRGYKHDLTAFEQWRAGRHMTKLLVEEYAAELQRAGRSPATINRVLASVRWWARRLSDLAYEGTLSRDEREEVVTQASRVAAIEDVKGKRERKGRLISHGELSALMRACVADESPAGVRDAAIIALAWATGARRAELAELHVSNFIPTGDDEGELRIHGKGDKVRAISVYNGAALALLDWLAIRGDADGPIFLATDKGGNVIRGERAYGVRGNRGKGSGVVRSPGMSAEALAQMLAKRSEQAGISQHLTWHDFRKTFGSGLLDAGVGLEIVQRLMGHSTPTLTANVYDLRDEEPKRKAVKTLHVPYKRRATQEL